MTDWTDQETDTLRRLYFDKGLSATAVALAMNRSRNSVLGKLNRDFEPLQAGERLRRLGRHAQRAGIASGIARRARLTRVRKQKPPAAMKAAKPQDARPEGALTLLDLEPHHCRWIVGCEEGDAIFCGEDRTEDKTCWYCARHRAVAWARHG